MRLKHDPSNPKVDVRLHGMQVPMIFAMMVANELVKEYDVEFVITSGVEGRHGKGSCHYSGNAFDFRKREFKNNDAAAVAKELQERLGPDFYVLLERTHIHVQFKPQTGYITDVRV